MTSQAIPGMVILGAGECGARAALTLRERGYQGPVTLIGDEPHLPYERPPLSKQTMLDPAEPIARFVAGESALAAARVTFLGSSRVRSIDRAARLVKCDRGAPVAYGKLLLATGASPRRLALAEASRHCVYLRTFDDALAIRSHLHRGVRVAIIGGGFIGLELAASARMLGCPVTVIEAQRRILMRGVPEEIADVILSVHADHGAHVLSGRRVTAIGDIDGGVAVSLSDGSMLEADLAIIGVGAAPNTELAEAAGLAVDNGIVADEFLRTGDPDIFAAGDCCSFPLHIYGGRRVRLEAWRNAQEQGALAAVNMLGARQSQEAVPWVWSDQYDLGLQIAGLPDEGAETIRRDLDGNAFILFHLATDGTLVSASGIGPGNAIARDIRLSEMLIARRSHPPRDKLAAPDAKLKALLAA